MGSLWNRSGTIERYADDLRAAGAKAYFFLGGTTTPMTVFQDSGENSAHPHPVVADSSGRWPDVFVPYVTSYDVQVKSAFNVQLTYSVEIPNPNPVEINVDPVVDPGVVQTGMIHCELVNGTKASYVRLNGKTIGTGVSGATERANGDATVVDGVVQSDVWNLFNYLWNLPNTIVPILPSRGGSASSDFAANKQLTLPDFRGAAPLGLDDMGNTAGGFFAGLTFTNGTAIQAGSLLGTNAQTLTVANLAAHSHTGSTADPGGAHTVADTTGFESNSHTHDGTTSGGSAHQHSAFIGDDGHTHSGTVGAGGVAASGAATGSAVYASSSTVGQALAINTGFTGVKVRSTAGDAASANNLTATESAHIHTFTSEIQSDSHTHNFSVDVAAHGHTLTIASNGSGTPFNNLGRSILVTWFIKL